MTSTRPTADYVLASLNVASRLIGKRILHFERLSNLAPESSVAANVGALLVECDDGFCLLIVEELQQANLLVRAVDDAMFARLEDSCSYWTPVFDVDAPARARYGWPFQQPIETVEWVYVSQAPGDYLHGEFCGLRLTTQDGEQVTVGLGLTGESSGLVRVFRNDALDEAEAWRDDLGFERLDLELAQRGAQGSTA